MRSLIEFFQNFLFSLSGKCKYVQRRRASFFVDQWPYFPICAISSKFPAPSLSFPYIELLLCTLPFLLPFRDPLALCGLRTDGWTGRTQRLTSIHIKDSHDMMIIHFTLSFLLKRLPSLPFFVSPTVCSAQLKRTSPRYSLH